jgi:hypothetical protein
VTQATTVPRHPDVAVTLTGDEWTVDGNALEVLSAVQAALRSAGVPDAEVIEFHTQATAGDYDHLLQTALRWVHVS